MREELEEKRCMSSMLCPTEYQSFYRFAQSHGREGGWEKWEGRHDGASERAKGVCALWAEAFFFATAADESPQSR